MEPQPLSVARREHVSLVLTAMPEEARALRGLLRETRRVRKQLWRGQLGRMPVLLAATGDGSINAQREAQRVLDDPAWEIERVLVLGVAGALSEELRVGDVIVASKVQREITLQPTSPGAASTRRHSPADGLRATPAFVDAAVDAIGARPGVVVSARQIADSKPEKQRLLAQTDGAAPAVVDLETHSYVTLAEQRGIPWLVLRVISDTADETLPALLRRCSDESGAVQRARVARTLLRDPRPLPGLLRLSQRVARASRHLASVAGAALAGMPPAAADRRTL